MRRVCLAVGSLVLSSFLVGCGETAPPEVATKDDPQKALDAVKKMQEGAIPTAKGMMPASEVPKK
jgi:hypothetical protein